MQLLAESSVKPSIQVLHSTLLAPLTQATQEFGQGTQT